MALIVSSALMVAIAPVITISVATRVQARRIDLATQAARGYVDGLRANAINPPSKRGAKFSQSSAPGAGNDLGIPAPSAMSRDQGIDPNSNCLDKSLNNTNCRNSDSLLAIQSFRDGPLNSDDAVKQGYCVGVRVYRADAFQGDHPTQTRPSPSPISNTKLYPLVVMKTQIITKTSFEDYKNFYKLNPNNPNSPTKPNPNPCDG